MRHFVKDGTAKAFCLWDLAQLGQVSVSVAHQLAEGKISGKQGEKVKVDGVGTFTIGKDGELEVNKPIIFIKDNVDQYQF